MKKGIYDCLDVYADSRIPGCVGREMFQRNQNTVSFGANGKVEVEFSEHSPDVKQPVDRGRGIIKSFDNKWMPTNQPSHGGAGILQMQINR